MRHAVLVLALLGQAPEHLQPAIEEVARADLPVLAPPERPAGTTDTVAEVVPGFYRLLFTNDPESRLSHAEQVNVFVSASGEPHPPPPDALAVPVRSAEGWFFCGAAACFLEWREAGATYSVGEFGSPEDAAGFAESLLPLEEVAAADPGPAPAGDGPSPVLLGVLGVGGVAVLAGAARALWARRR